MSAVHHYFIQYTPVITFTVPLTWINFNSLAPGKSECDSKNAIFNLVLLIGIFRSSHYDALRWMPQDLTDDKSTLVQVMAWCRQAPSPYLSQCWLSSLSPYGVARPQWVNHNIGKQLHPVKYVGWKYFTRPKIQHCRHWSLGISSFIPHFTGHLITYPCWDQS